MQVPSTDLGGFAAAKYGAASVNSGAPSLITAAGTGDATKVTGATVDRKSATDGSLADSALVATLFLAALADTETIAFAHEVQYSDDNSNWDDAVELEASDVKATSSGGTNETGIVEFSINLRSQKRYMRVNVTPNLSASGTDTALFATIVALSGYARNPQ